MKIRALLVACLGLLLTAQDYNVPFRPRAAGGVTPLYENAFETTGATCVGDGATNEVGSPECDCTNTEDANCPLSQTESAAFETVKAAAATEAGWGNVYTGVSSGNIWADVELIVGAVNASQSAPIFTLTTTDTGFTTRAYLQVNTFSAPFVLTAVCGDFSNNSGGTLSLDTLYKVRFEHHIGNDTLTVYVDTSSGYGTTSYASCDGTGTISTPIDSFRMGLESGTAADLYFDDLGICDQDPGATKCGTDN